MTARWMRTVLAAIAIGASTMAFAEPLKLYHDKYFWQESMKRMATYAESKGHPFVPTPYATDQYQAFIATGVQSGNAPEIFTWWNGTKLKDLVDADALQPLDDVWKEAVSAGQMDPASAELYTVDGKIYGVPLHLSSWVVFYNKALFKQAGLEPPKSWSDLLAACDKLKAAGITPFDATVQDGWRGFIWFEELLLRTDPAAYMKLNSGELSYTSPQVKAVFKLWGDLYAKGYFTPATSNEEVLNFARGKAAMYLMGDWAIQNIKEGGMKPGEDFGAFVMPNVDPSLPPSVINEGAPIVVSKAGAKNPDVMAFVKWWMTDEAASQWAKDPSLNIGNIKAPKPNVVVEDVAKVLAATKAKPYPRYWEASPSDIVLPAVEQFNKFMVTPTPEVADQVMAAVDKIASDYWAAHK
ncbi:ABC transporter substrate-binding protein [Labrys wisconsinensis]|uniref:Multiple sugar transport system substrate-binding protein n=1 Tax=Labrys wisconsinensis TaxID=425677 RepID=A0ABU0J8E7_9HYPH|nr:extracellular solute-binding protein [Labrys wisconsinensis]MDQ0469875.1 multiple sugar transport system substrate-binding protein [Labrys wisconsinensis]